ncbi:helix-turn-helix domain-containing protein [Streptomyces sp. Ag109_O5-10]|uniref:helix-turn-helix domain-containing protein n=1 Tax=Streptomyces sp. Ag109_O5-10 TaxID=1855349 RepID=UPI00089B4924|nr:helix-turn-helix domain-containing protein [Streptomyces sp. Ag109_O5-10]SEF09383.1 AAA ATPase domain-containing protein [Streptomyces sp. Ag109_O5-10]
METPSVPGVGRIAAWPSERETPVTLLREPAVAAGEPREQDIPLGFRQDRADDGGTGAAPFGRRLRDLRLRSGLSQKQLARSSTLSVRAIRDLENGRVRQPRADSLRLLAEALGLSAPQLNRLTNGHSPGCPASAAEPAVSGPFIGREQELAALTTMLGADHHRLITITGIEGVGKTRLAREVTHALEAAEHATVLWLPLDDDRLRSGRAPVGAPDQPTWWREVVHRGPDSRRRLAETIGDADSILVLDGARPEDELTDLTAHLLAVCPRLRILVTTRNPGGMPLDTLFPLAPLPVPSPDIEPEDLDAVASVALLLAQTKRIRPAFRPDPHVLADVARICHALDGLPAALESVAHWSLIYSLRQLARQLAVEPLTVARRPLGGPQRPDAYASVHHTVATLSSRQRDLLSIMSQKPSRESDGYWSVAEVADQMGLPAAECADDVYHLVILGILRRVDRHDVAMFKVLNIVGIVGQHATAGRNGIAGQHTAA